MVTVVPVWSDSKLTESISSLISITPQPRLLSSEFNLDSMFGIATPAEAAAMGALGGLLLAILYRSLTWSKVKESVFLTAKATAMVCWLFIGSWTFASVFSYLGGHDVIEHWVLALNLEPWQFLVMVQLIIFILGWPLEWSEILIIFVI